MKSADIRQSNIVFNIDRIKLLCAALLLAGAAALLSACINTNYFDTYPIAGDMAYPYSYSADAYIMSVFNGRASTLFEYIFTEQDRSLWYIFPLIINPELLVDVNGFIFIAGGVLFCFLLTMGIVIHKFSGSSAYAIACMAAVLAAQNFFDPVYGMGNHYADLQSAWLVGAALFALIGSDEAKSGKWLAMCGLFSALATRSRFASLGVIAVICGPILAFYLFKRWQVDRLVYPKPGGRIYRVFLLPLIQTGVPYLLVSGYQVYSITVFFIRRYFLGVATSGGLSHMFKPVSAALAAYFSFYDSHLGALGVIVLVLFLVLNFTLYWQVRCKDVSGLFVSVWAASAFVLVHIFVLRLQVDYTAYTLPGFYLLAFMPFRFDAQKLGQNNLNLRKYLLYLQFILIVLFTAAGFFSVKNKYKGNDISEFGQKLKSYSRELSVILADISERYGYEPHTLDQVPAFESFVEAESAHTGLPLHIDLIYREKRLFRWKMMTWGWINLYKANYPGLTLAEIQESIYRKSLEELDFVIVQSDPRNEEALPLKDVYPELEKDEWNLKVNEYMRQQVDKDKENWADEQLNFGGLYQSPYGEIHVFRNLRRYNKR